MRTPLLLGQSRVACALPPALTGGLGGHLAAPPQVVITTALLPSWKKRKKSWESDADCNFKAQKLLILKSVMCPELKATRPAAGLHRPVWLPGSSSHSERDKSSLRINARVLYDENQVLSRAVLVFLVRNRLPWMEVLVRQTYAHYHRVKCHLNGILASFRSLWSALWVL